MIKIVKLPLLQWYLTFLCSLARNEFSKLSRRFAEELDDSNYAAKYLEETLASWDSTGLLIALKDVV